MTEEELRAFSRNNYAAQMKMLGYQTDGNPKDMVDVVRCCDCKYWEEHHKWGREGGSYVAPKCNRLMKKTRSNWFCADGKRR